MMQPSVGGGRIEIGLAGGFGDAPQVIALAVFQRFLYFGAFDVVV